jgi:hypothetical protein
VILGIWNAKSGSKVPLPQVALGKNVGAFARVTAAGCSPHWQRYVRLGYSSPRGKETKSAPPERGNSPLQGDGGVESTIALINSLGCARKMFVLTDWMNPELAEFIHERAHGLAEQSDWLDQKLASWLSSSSSISSINRPLWGHPGITRRARRDRALAKFTRVLPLSIAMSRARKSNKKSESKSMGYWRARRDSNS